ncbi:MULTISPECIES: ATP-binding cassette domain-containing protein [Pseudomonadota]|jgi:ABC-type multidrug transport system ATPase subunit|uniref:ATP-binding cassette domain-containing protein n=1 Tax=Pseudomonadota TaxID=1224 RepID=UPI000769E2CF|nr:MULTISPECIES: ATP-binding cassette domain-containing protein [Pseudomonadota]MAF61605.1 ABC transporter ATP-binding protein [Blastomonas sp.]|tara:strand:+ start:75893 stop:76528 length:636 start_codon:yes stop_codon:yes gene_type:complete
MLTLTDISRSYGRKRVLDGISATFPTGLTLLVGPSGAGKSTLLRLLATAEKPNAGTIAWDGAALPGARKALRATLGYAPQAVDLPEDLTAREFALHMAALKGLDARSADLQFGAITERIGLHADINNRISTFSGGMRRRLVFAQAMLGAPRLLALDEPTAELDGETAASVSSLIVERAREAVVVMTTHLADALAPQAVQVLRVDQGRVAPQ